MWPFKRTPCDHDWRDIYGDEILARNCRSICRKCGKRSPTLMNTHPKEKDHE